jgi:hypothetical protein
MKKDVPNICKNSNVSSDYIIAFGSLTNYLERIVEDDPPRTRHLAQRAFFRRLIPKYEEYFNPEEFKDVINSRNKEVVDKINRSVDKLNVLRAQKISDFEVLSTLNKRMVKLIACGE